MLFRVDFCQKLVEPCDTPRYVVAESYTEAAEQLRRFVFNDLGYAEELTVEATEVVLSISLVSSLSVIV